MKGLIDMDDTEVETEAKNKKSKKKTPEEEFDELAYKKRCKLVALSKNGSFNEFVQFIKDNEKIFVKADGYDRECMRRTCERAITRYPYYDEEAVAYIDRIFGPHVDVMKSILIPTYTVKSYTEPKMTLEEEIRYRSCGTYYAMWDFITNPEFQEKLKGRTDLYDKVKFMIDRAKEENECVVPGKLKSYEPSDEEMYVKVLNLMKEVKE